MAQLIIDDYLPLDNKERIDVLLNSIESNNVFFDNYAVGKVLIYIQKVKLQLYFKSRIDSFNEKLTGTTSSETNNELESTANLMPPQSTGRAKKRRKNKKRSVLKYDGFFIGKLTLPESLASVDYKDLMPLYSFDSVSKLAVRIWASNIRLSRADKDLLLSNFEPLEVKSFFIKKMESLIRCSIRAKSNPKKIHFKGKYSKGKHESNSLYTSIYRNMRSVSIPMGGANKRY